MFLALIVYITMVVLPAVKASGFVAAGLIAAITLFCLCTWGMPYEKEAQERGRVRLNTWLKGGWIKVLVAVVLIGAFTPNEKVTWYIVGAYAAEKVATADTTKELASGAYDIFRDLVKKAQENLGEVDAKTLQEKAEKAFDTAQQTLDNAQQQLNKQGEAK